MSQTTAKGVPYALPADLRRDWPTTSQAVATWVNDHVPVGLWGGAYSVNMNNGTHATVAVTFPAGRFTQAPIVVAGRTNSQTAGEAASATVAAYNITKDGCTIGVTTRAAAAGTVQVNVIAYQASSGSAAG